MTSLHKHLQWLPPPSEHSKAIRMAQSLPHPTLPLSASPPSPSHSPSVTWSQSLWPPCFPRAYRPDMVLPQSLCTCCFLSLGSYPPDVHVLAPSSVSSLFSKAFADCAI